MAELILHAARAQVQLQLAAGTSSCGSSQKRLHCSISKPNCKDQNCNNIEGQGIVKYRLGKALGNGTFGTVYAACTVNETTVVSLNFS
jgi:hypothetical protein